MFDMTAAVATVAIVAAYFLPWIVASLRGHRNTNAIALLNLFLNWTLLGWLAALIWSATANVEPEPQV